MYTAINIALIWLISLSVNFITVLWGHFERDNDYYTDKELRVVAQLILMGPLTVVWQLWGLSVRLLSRLIRWIEQG